MNYTKQCGQQRFLKVERLELRYLLSAVGFVARELVESDAKGARSVYAADVDGDVDVLYGSIGSIGWYENSDGQGTLLRQQVISTKVFDAVCCHEYSERNFQ
jgi:hypothetical protein